MGGLLHLVQRGGGSVRVNNRPAHGIDQPSKTPERSTSSSDIPAYSTWTRMTHVRRTPDLTLHDDRWRAKVQFKLRLFLRSCLSSTRPKFWVVHVKQHAHYASVTHSRLCIYLWPFEEERYDASRFKYKGLKSDHEKYIHPKCHLFFLPPMKNSLNTAMKAILSVVQFKL